MDTLLYLGLNNALMATLLAVAIAAVAWFLRHRPALVHCLWLLVLLKLVTPPLLGINLPWPNRSPTGSLSESEPVSLPRQVEPPVALDATPAEGDLSVTTASEAPRSIAVEFPREDLSQAPPPVSSSSVSAPPAFPDVPWEPMIGGAWLAGSVLWWALAGLRLHRFQRSLRYARPAPAAVQKQARRLTVQMGLRRCPEVSFLPATITPLLWAIVGRPRLLSPFALWQQCSEEQREALLVHELAHLRRRDHWVRHLELVVLGLYWWHPVAWWARRKLQEAEEECCDAWVVATLPGAGPAYAQLLVDVVRFLSPSRFALPRGVSGIGHVPLVKRRLTMILQATTPNALSRAGFWMTVGLAAVLLPFAPTWAQTESRPSREHALPTTPPPESTVNPTAGTGGLTHTTSTDQNTAALDAVPLTPEDAVQLLRLQLQSKQAELQEIQALLRGAKYRVEMFKKMAQTIGAGEIIKAATDVEVYQARLMGKEAQVKEAELRLKMAERQVPRSPDLINQPRTAVRREEQTTGRTGGESPPVGQVETRATLSGASGDRLDRLEKNVQLLMQAVRKLREELRSQKTTVPEGGGR